MKRKHSSEEIRRFILENIEKNPKSINSLVSKKYGISRQSVHRHLLNLVEEGIIKAEGNTRSRKYSLIPIIEKVFTISITNHSEEDFIWRHKIRPLFNSTSSNVVEICHYGFTEMMNNVIDHSGTLAATISFKRFSNKLELVVMDEGIGIFKKIYRELNLEDERHAVLELTKGKLTTDKEHHTGEGIFFTSRMFDEFSIVSGSLYFSYTQGKEENWLLQDEKKDFNGTFVTMLISTSSSRTTKEVFDKYTAQDDGYSFTRTHVPVNLVRYGDEQLVSRSQAKRLLARLEPFKEIFLDFEGVESIGQAFTDEIFRVFKNEHPEINIIWINENKEIYKMIRRVLGNSSSDEQLRLKL